MRTLLIGTGRVAFNLGHAMVRAGVDLIGVAGRDPDHTEQLADRLNVPPFHLKNGLPQADLILIAVSDDAIAEVADRIAQQGAVVAHTSGATPIDRIKGRSKRGVIWPVQTFISEALVPLDDVPLIVEGGDRSTTEALRTFASRMSNNVIELDHAQRQKAHLAAVFVSNFPAALVREAEALLNDQDLPRDLLLPLWKRTAGNIEAMGAANALTGPAKRGDRITIAKHLELLNDDPELQAIYRAISERIMDRVKKDQ